MCNFMTMAPCMWTTDAYRLPAYSAGGRGRCCDLWPWGVFCPLTLARGVLWPLTLGGGEVFWPLTLDGGRCYDLWPWPGGGVMTFDPGQGGGVVTFDPGHWDRAHLPPTPILPFSDRMTNTCENITFARFATRAVKIFQMGISTSTYLTTWDSMVISHLYFSYITFYVLLIITKIIHDIKMNK